MSDEDEFLLEPLKGTDEGQERHNRTTRMAAKALAWTLLGNGIDYVQTSDDESDAYVDHRPADIDTETQLVCELVGPVLAKRGAEGEVIDFDDEFPNDKPILRPTPAEEPIDGSMDAALDLAESPEQLDQAWEEACDFVDDHWYAIRTYGSVLGFRILESSPDPTDGMTGTEFEEKLSEFMVDDDN